MKKTIFLLIILILTSCSSSDDRKKSEYNDQNSNLDNDIESLDDDIVLNPDFLAGPYGTNFGDTADDFTIPTEKGEWNFAQNRSEDESYIFIFYRPSNSQSTAIWKTDLIKFVEKSPDNVQYFFLVDAIKDTFDDRISLLKSNLETAFTVGGNTDLRNRIHIASKPVDDFEDSWISQWLDSTSDFFLGIDRFQKLRKGGLFHSWKTSTIDPHFEFVYKEAEYYNYEHDLNKSYSSTDMIRIKGIEGAPFSEEGWEKELFFIVDIPEFPAKGKLLIELEQVCESAKACEWDRIEHLHLCEGPDSDICNIEIGRWITTYGRSGKWVTDITPLLPLIKQKGKNKFKFSVAGDQYTNYLDLLFIPDESSDTPLDIHPLYSGTTQFNEEYNTKFEEITLDIPANAKKVFISAYITGHGNGSEQENCAEFCKFESIFNVNGTDFEIDFDNAGTDRGCFDLVNEGVVPNQSGSWPFGRAGWCPGQDVKLINIDITDNVITGTNTFAYKGFLDGEIYKPVVTNPEGYRAEIPLTSYIVIWE